MADVVWERGERRRGNVGWWGLRREEIERDEFELCLPNRTDCGLTATTTTIVITKSVYCSTTGAVIMVSFL